jgi:K+-transporting ATPase KdpF subunit
MMQLEFLVGLLVVFLFFYLVYALLSPEKF